MKVLRLRVLARKSILGFGSAEIRDLSVQQIMDLKKHKKLVQAYFGLDRISFKDDILDELGITPDMRLNKPDKVKDWPKRCSLITQAMTNFYNSNNYKDKDFIKLYARRNRITKAINVSKRASRHKTKEQLQSKNHGK